MVNMNPTISILVPVYNVHDFILRCLESIANQTYSGSIECIVVDDCGTDGSIEIAKKFISEYNGRVVFRVLHHVCNRGLAAARNTAVEAAAGEFVMHVDSDDWLEPTAVEHLLLKQEEIDADIVSGQALEHTQNGTSILKDPDCKTPMDLVRCMIEMTIDHVIWRRLIRRSLYVDNNINAFEGVNVGEDHHTMPRLAYYARKVATLDEIVCHYNCLNPNSYMSARTSRFNMGRFRSDYSSIKILQDFFETKDEYCATRLRKIERDFLENSMKDAAMRNDISAYDEISVLSARKLSFVWYWQCYGRYVGLKKILKGFVKKILRG